VATPLWFTLRYDTASRFLLTLFGAGPARSGIAVEDDVACVMGRLFRGRAPRPSVVGASIVSDRVLSRGVHGWRGDWLVNGAGRGLVELRFEPPMRATVTMVPVKVRRLRVSVDDPEGLVAVFASSA
jgi:hypothetical protein